MRRLSSVLLALALGLGVVATPLGTATADSSLFTRLEGFATKTGFRGVFAWSASQPVAGVVHYGTDPNHLDKSTAPLPGVDDTSQLAVADGLVTGSTIYWQVEDTLSGDTSATQSFVATNAYNSWDGQQYTINLLVQLDSQSLPPDVPSDLAISEIAQGMSIFAERLYDATDHYVRLGKVLVTDTNLDYAANIPNTPSIALNACAPQTGAAGPNLADVIIQTSQPFDSHTYSGFAINSPCISFYVGRIGQLVIPWEDDLHLGYVSTHEMSHYAFNAPDLYPVGQAELPADPQCRNLAWDGSVMHNTGGWAGNTWELTEYDRNASLTPCDMGSPAEPFTWDAMRARYTHIPANAAGPIDHVFDTIARGNPDGGALQITTLDREPGSSSLVPFSPWDGGGVACNNQSPVIVDPEDDANQVLGTGGTPAPSESNLDVTKTFLTYDDAADAVTFHIDVKDLTDTHPTGSQGEIFELFFKYGTQQHYIDISRSDLSGEAFVLYNATNGTRGTTKWLDLTGSFDNAANEITAVLPLGAYNAQLAARLEPDPATVGTGSLLDGFSITTRKDDVAIVPDADSAIGQCTYAVGQELIPSNGAPVASPDIATTPENTGVVIDVLANDSDPENDALSLTSVAPAFHGATSVLGSTVLYVPSPGYHGPDSFTYTVTDATSSAATGSVSVTVTPGPQAPEAVADRKALGSSGGVIDVLANDSDSNGDPLSVSGVTNGLYGTVTTNGATVTYTPTAPVHWNSDAFTYTVTDGGLTSTAQVIVTNNACASTFNEPLNSGSLPAGWSHQLAQGANSPAWDVRPDGLTHTGSYAFNSSADSTEIKDDRLVSPLFRATHTTVLTWWHRYAFENTFDGGVLEVSTDNGTTWQDVLAAGGTFLAGGYTTDAEGNPVTIDATSTGPLPGRRAWTGSSFVDADTEVGVDLGALAGQLVKVRWRLGTDDIVPGTGVPGWWIDDVQITGTTVAGCTTGLNTGPTAVDDIALTARNHVAAIDVAANDTDPDTAVLQVQSVGAAAHGTTSVVSGKARYAPAAGYVGPDAFAYTVTDGVSTATAVVHVTVRPGLVPVGDFDGDRKTDITVFRPTTSEWWTRGKPAVIFGGQSSDVALIGDFTGDRKVDQALYRPSTGEWLVRGRPTVTLGGMPGDVPVPADYDGDGIDDVAVFRSLTGEWLTYGKPTVTLGRKGDVPVPADYDGDGDADRAIFRPVDGTWLTGGAPFTFGSSSDRPVPADYNGDGAADMAIFRPSTGQWVVIGLGTFTWGQSGDVPQPGDYNGDGKTEPAVFRPATSTWLVQNVVTAQWGTVNDVAVNLPPALRKSLDGKA